MTKFPSSLNAPVILAQAVTLSSNLSAIANLDNRETLALVVISKVHVLSGQGGFDYRANHKQLRADAAAFMGGFNFVGPMEGPMVKLMAAIDWNGGFVSDASFPTDVNALVSEMAGMRETPEQTLWLFYFFLCYRLSLLGF